MTKIIPESATFNDDEAGTEAYRLAEQFVNFEVGDDLSLRTQLLSGSLTELITALRTQFSPTTRPEWIEQALDLMDPASTFLRDASPTTPLGDLALTIQTVQNGHGPFRDQLQAMYRTDLGKQWWEFYRQNRRFTSFIREYSTERKRALGLGKKSEKRWKHW
ncbi:hypothetical protein SCAR479_12611 [Seiridium cardinale]|uniref:Uncharacterized protein n=1 Tax=Seiridium cardinale TaxID=138064 RepID=A0ABR2XAL8_9PEZI